MDDVTEEMLADATVICVSLAGALREYRCDWWVMGPFGNVPPPLPSTVSVCAVPTFIAACNRPGLATATLRSASGHPRHSFLATDALKLAWHLGYRQIEVWGADWCRSGSIIERWAREVIEWKETIVTLGLEVTRNGEPLQERTFTSFVWSGKRHIATFPVPNRRVPGTRMADSDHQLRRDRDRVWNGMRDSEVAAVIAAASIPQRAVRSFGNYVFSDGDSASALYEAVEAGVKAGSIAVDQLKHGTIYAIPDAAGRNGEPCPRGERSPAPMVPTLQAGGRTAGPPAAWHGGYWANLGPKLWAELHARALAFTGDKTAEQAWLAAFPARLPCGNCGTHWAEMIQRTPPDLTSADAYWRWTVDRHNEVNVRIGKPVWAGEADHAAAG